MPDQEWYWRERQKAIAQIKARRSLPTARAFIAKPTEVAQEIRHAADARERELRRNPPPDEPLTPDGVEWKCWGNLDRERIAIERAVADEIAAVPPFNEAAVRALMARLKSKADALYPEWPWSIYNSLRVQIAGWLLPQAVEPNESHSSVGYTHMAPHIAARIAALADAGLLVLAEPRGQLPLDLYAPLFSEAPRHRRANGEHVDQTR